MGGVVRKVTGAPNRKEVARMTAPTTSPIQAIAPTPELAAPVIADVEAQPEAKEAVITERKKSRRQKGRASTVFGGSLGDDSAQGSTARVTLGA